MTSIFLSHASADRDTAYEVAAWLKSQGYEDVFLDFAREGGIGVGTNWEREIYDKLRRCHIMLALVSDAWTSSHWCFAELCFSRQDAKPIIPVVLQSPSEKVSFDLQGVRWNEIDAKERLAEFLRNFSLEIHGGFNPTPGRAPFPGLRAFDEKDAPFLFGRDAEIGDLYKRLSSTNAPRDPHMTGALAVIGPSGSGKSSLVRAGLLPRLRRAVYESRWRVGTAVRPLDLRRHDVTEVLELSGFEANAADHAVSEESPTLLITLDQFEEVFALPPASQARVLEAVSVLMAGAPHVQLLLTVRSDSIGSVQKLDFFRRRLALFGVAPLALERFPDIISGPARLCGIEPTGDLLQRIVSDAKTPDALPLLAFAIRQIYDFDPGARTWTLGDYERLSAVEGRAPLDDVVTKVASSAIDGATDLELNALRHVFTTLIADVNERGEHVRRAGIESQMPDEARRLIDALVDSRILVRQSIDGIATIEVAHEAVLRVWPLVRDWLRDASVSLNLWSNVTRAAGQWMRADDDVRPQLLLHGGEQFETVAQLLASGRQADTVTRDYIEACEKSHGHYMKRRHRERGGALLLGLFWTPIGMVLLWFFQILVAPALGWWDLFQLTTLAAVLGLMLNVMQHYRRFESADTLIDYSGRLFEDLDVKNLHARTSDELTRTVGVTFAVQAAAASIILGAVFLVLWLDFAAVSSAAPLLGWGNRVIFTTLVEPFPETMLPLLGVIANVACVYLGFLTLRWHIAIWDFVWDGIGRFWNVSQILWAHTLNDSLSYGDLMLFEMATPRPPIVQVAPRPITMAGVLFLPVLGAGLIWFWGPIEWRVDILGVPLPVLLWAVAIAAMGNAVVLLDFGEDRRGNRARVLGAPSSIHRWLVSIFSRRKRRPQLFVFDTALVSVLAVTTALAIAWALLIGGLFHAAAFAADNIRIPLPDAKPMFDTLWEYYVRTPQTTQVFSMLAASALVVVVVLVLNILRLAVEPVAEFASNVLRPAFDILSRATAAAFAWILRRRRLTARVATAFCAGPSIPPLRIMLWRDLWLRGRRRAIDRDLALRSARSAA